MAICGVPFIFLLFNVQKEKEHKIEIKYYWKYVGYNLLR